MSVETANSSTDKGPNLRFSLQSRRNAQRLLADYLNSVKMVQRHRYIFIALSLFCVHVIAKRKYTCPIGFSIAYTRGDDPICYRQKGPEAFGDKFKDCPGNLYTSKLYHSLNITKTELVLWAEYKSTYPGGPFIDWSYTESTGDMLLTTYDVNYDKSLGLDQELCVVIDPVMNFTASVCDEEHFRYCFIKPYPSENDMATEGCKEFSDSWRFYSPSPTCLKTIKGVGGGTVRATWKQAEELCHKKGAALLSKGWRYSNNPLLHTSDSYPMYPLGMEFDSTGNLRYEDIYDNAVVILPLSSTARTTYSTLLQSNNLISAVDNNTSLECIRFTDNVTLAQALLGYYWCIHIDSKNFQVTESNRALFVREKTSLVNLYAIKIILKSGYRFENLDEMYRNWKRKLREYIFYYTKYTKVNGEVDIVDFERFEAALKEFKNANAGLKVKEKDVITVIKIKHLYLDGKTALVHLELNPEMVPVPPGTWDGMKVQYMKRAYYCKGVDSIPMLALGQSTITSGCRQFTCVGDFNEGVQWVTTALPDCITRQSAMVTETYNVTEETNHVTLIMPTVGTMEPVRATRDHLQRDITSESSEEIVEIPSNVSTPQPNSSIDTTSESHVTTAVTLAPAATNPTTEDTETSMAATPTRPRPPSNTTPITTTLPPTTTTQRTPQDQLQQVMDDLGALINNDSTIIVIEDIDEAFNQVDELLAVTDDLEIPGELLHLLDNIGARIDLNGSEEATAVRENIALLIADAQPQMPVKGLRIATRETDVFSDGAFEIIREEVNSTHLRTEESEVVVALPPSVASSSRRISFVVFRNDRAFQSNHTTYSVNSRVLSINVENTTEFHQGEVIDIHLTPMLAEPESNQSRSCAYWHFLEDGTGFWSQEGCTFIRAAQAGMLDTCRCDHLTHFAEILIPRTNFSDAHENALQILSMIGCFLSIIGLLLIGLTAILFRSWRRDFSNKVWLHLCVAILFLSLCFLIVCFTPFDTYNIGCMLVGILLHYSVLASFSWMLVAAVLSYRRLVMVFTRDASHKLLRASAFAWGAPCAVVGILLSVAPDSYAGQFGESVTNAFCYPSGLSLWLSVYAPIAIMLFANWTLFILIVRSVFASKRIQRHGDSNEALRCASVSCLLVFLFGLPWIFGLFPSNIVTVYLFVLTATYQGFVLFIFFVVGNKKTRDLWLNKLKIKQTRKIPVTSSTFTNRSTGGNPGWRTPAGGPASMEAKNSKPRSLASPDDSRFS
ncbi:hypothetical protein K1T71_003656 [Dendrolimus kikuchii]|uniref:Uncharacterized protein n=1 Tax=Dendrolimus kikuchii TaxID=765133 RepID=A0ACC1D9K9_9NEOP|nr:hypothetical protein K1T71_003656 [Dendrolimus kikuchii]